MSCQAESVGEESEVRVVLQRAAKNRMRAVGSDRASLQGAVDKGLCDLSDANKTQAGTNKNKRTKNNFFLSDFLASCLGL